MSSNSATIVQEVYEEFESMLHYVQHSETETAYAAERTIFKRLLKLGHSLMVLFFTFQAERYPRTAVETETGERLPYHSEKKQSYFSIFGKLPVWRPYFHKTGVGSASPLDEALSLGEDCYSDVVREIAEYVGTANAYEKGVDLFRYLLGQSLGKNAVQLMVAEDAEDVEAYYEQKAAPAVPEEGRILVIQADDKGVPLVKETEVVHKVRLGKGEKRSRKKEAVVTSVYTIEPNPRSPEGVVASLFRQETPDIAADAPSKRVKPQHKEVWATLEGKDTALTRLAARVEKREGGHITERVALTDGAEALQERVLRHCPDFTLILDFIHANEYLWDAANRLYREQDPLSARPGWHNVASTCSADAPSKSLPSYAALLRHLAPRRPSRNNYTKPPITSSATSSTCTMKNTSIKAGLSPLASSKGLAVISSRIALNSTLDPGGR